MSKRPATVLAAFVVLLIGAAALAQKNASTTIKLVRLEGKSQEFLLEAAAVATGAAASWQPAADSNGNGDAPALEYTAGDPKTLSFDLAFDTFESKDSVHDKFVRPLEDLTAVDPSLDRPPMVQVVWRSNSFPAFKGVVEIGIHQVHDVHVGRNTRSMHDSGHDETGVQGIEEETTVSVTSINGRQGRDVASTSR